MRQVFAGLLVGVSVAGFGGIRGPGAQLVTGQLVDAACYELNKSNIGADHKMPQGEEQNCAVACVKTGLPAALLTSDRKVYIVTGPLAEDNNAKLLPYLGHTVVLTGRVSAGIDPIRMDATDLNIVAK